MTARFERLRTLLIGTDYEKAFFNIMANGISEPSENPTYQQHLARKNSKIKDLEKEVSDLKIINKQASDMIQKLFEEDEFFTENVELRFKKRITRIKKITKASEKAIESFNKITAMAQEKFFSSGEDQDISTYAFIMKESRIMANKLIKLREKVSGE
jgi:hypothetical protein